MRSSSTADSKDRLGLAAISVGLRRHGTAAPSEPGRRFGAPGSGSPGGVRAGAAGGAGALLVPSGWRRLQWVWVSRMTAGPPCVPGSTGRRPGTGKLPASRRSSPRLRPPDGTGTASAFTRGSAPRGYPQRTPGRRRANAHWPGYRTYGLSRTSNSTSHLTHVPSRRTSCTVASMVSRRAGRTFSHLACGTGMHRIRTAPARAGAPCRLAGVRQPHPHLLAHVFQMTGFTWEDLGLREDFVHPGAQRTPRSPNAPEH
jgi:hypothetical protein